MIDEKEEDKSSKTPTFELYAILNHHGDIESNSYSSFCKGE